MVQMGKLETHRRGGLLGWMTAPSTPTVSFPSSPGRHDGLGPGLVCGQEAQSKCSILLLKYPTERGIITN